MTGNLISKAAALFAGRQHGRFLRMAAMLVAGIVVFATTYALILPAITIDVETAAGEPGMELGSVADAAEPPADELVEAVSEPVEPQMEPAPVPEPASEPVVDDVPVVVPDEPVPAQDTANEQSEPADPADSIEPEPQPEVNVQPLVETPEMPATPEPQATAQGESPAPAAPQPLSGTLSRTLEEKGLVFEATFGPEAGIPQGTELHIDEIVPLAEEDMWLKPEVDNPDTLTFEQYRDIALDRLRDREGADPARDLQYLRLFDIRLWKDGAEVVPAAPVSVKVTLRDGITVEKGSTLDVASYIKVPASGEKPVELLEHVGTKLRPADPAFPDTPDVVEELTFEQKLPWVAGFMVTAPAAPADEGQVADASEQSVGEPQGVANEQNVAGGEGTVPESSETDSADPDAADAPTTDGTTDTPSDDAATEDASSEEAPEGEPSDSPDDAAPAGDPADAPATTLEFAGPDYTVTAAFAEGNEPQEGSELVVKEVPSGTEDHVTLINQALDALDEADRSGDAITYARFFGVMLQKDGEPCGPGTPASLALDYAPQLDLAADETLEYVQFSDDGAKIVDEKDFELDGTALVGTVVTRTTLVGSIEAGGETYKVAVSFGSQARVPCDAELQVREITPDDPEWQGYYDRAQGAVNGKGLAARFFDIKIMSGGVEVEPACDVDVRITCEGPADVDQPSSAKVVHFADVPANEADAAQAEPPVDELIDAAPLEASDGAAPAGVSFTTGSFSVFGVVYTIDIHSEVLTASGDRYEITVTYDSDAEIPDGVELRVKEITEEDEAYSQIREQLQGNLEEGVEGIPSQPVLFDISLWYDGHEIEPAEGSEIQVKVAFVGNSIKGMYTGEDSPILINDQPVTDAASEMEKQVQVLHLTDDALDVMETTDDITEAEIASSFTTDSFSNWLVYLDEDLTDINLTTGDSLTLRPYTEWVWKHSDEPTAYQNGEWVFPESNWNRVQTGTTRITIDGVTTSYPEYTYTHKTNGSQFKSFVKYDSQIKELYTVVTSTSLNAGTFDIQTNKGKIVHVNVKQGGSSQKPNTVPGIQGLTVNLFDYDVPSNNGNYDFTKSGSLDVQSNVATSPNNTNNINTNHDLKFLGYGGSNVSQTDTWFWINNYTQDVPQQGIVKTMLGPDGFPILTPGLNGQERGNPGLGYLFDPTSQNSNVYAFPNADGLFQQDNQGFYYYNSNANYAEYNRETNSFVLYEHTYSQNTGGSNGANAKPIGFFPFHEYDTADTQPEMNFNGNLNHHFGMSMTVDFQIPEDRQATDQSGNKHDIIYEFSGDDDLWVFVDDELVLDIGGIHQPVTGSINFTTGEIIVHGVDNTTKTFDVGAHTLKMFYIERGGCDSNLSVRFNLPLVRGKAELNVLKKSTVDDATQASIPLPGAIFGIWTDAACTGDPYMMAVSGQDGKVTFANIPIEDAGQVYYLKEIAPPSGYLPDSTVYTATAQGPDGSGHFWFDVQPSTGVQMEKEGDYPVVRDGRTAPISLTVQKQWQNADGTPIENPTGTAVFELKRNYTWVKETLGPANSIINVYRVNSSWGNPRLMVTKEFAGDSTASVNWTYHQNLWDGYKNWQYRVDQGPTQTKGDGPAQIYLTAGQTTNVYIFDGNMGGQYEQYGVENITVTGTEPSSSGHVETGSGEDTEYQGPTITLPTTSGAWSDVFNNLTVMEQKNDRTYYYEYYIVEKTVPDGYEAVFVDSAGNPIAGSQSTPTNTTGTQTVVNRKLLDVPIEKEWADFIGESFMWTASFQLEQMEVKVDPNAPDAPDAITTFTAVDGKTLTISKGQQTEPLFTGLPMYRVHSNGTVYRILYSVDETSYQVSQGNEVVAKWSRAGGLEVGSLYTPQFEQDAGEHGSNIDDYEIVVVNSLKDLVVSRAIELTVEKTWPDSSGIAEDEAAYAKFVLKRQVHEEYRDYSNVPEDTEWVDITLDTWGNGTNLQTVRVPKGTTMHIVGSVKGNTNANKIAFSQSSSEDTIELIVDNTLSADKKLFDIIFTADQTKTVALTQGDNYVVGGRDGFFLSDTYGNKTNDRLDPDFAVEFTLDKNNQWQEYYEYLPTVVEQDVNPKEAPQTVHVYSYYLEEVDSNPKGFTASFKDSNGFLLGDAANGIDTTQTIKAENRQLKGNLKVTKDLLGDVTGNDDRDFQVTIQNSENKYLQGDGSFANTPHPFTVSKSVPLEIEGLPVGTYTVSEITSDGAVDITGYLWNVSESTTTGQAQITDGQTALVELKNYYDEEYTPIPSDTNEYTDLVVDKDWIKADGGTTPTATDSIKIKVKVKSANAYLPVKWTLYDGNGQENTEHSGILYVQNGSSAAFTFDRFEAEKNSPGTSYWLNSGGVPLTINGISRVYANKIPHTGSTSGAWNNNGKTVVFTATANGAIEIMAQPYGANARWVDNPSSNGQRSWRTSVSNGGRYTSVDEMRTELIDDSSTVESLVYAIDGNGIRIVENETTCNVRPSETTVENWVATLSHLPTYLKIEQDGVISYKVYSYEIEEIEVNGEVVSNGRTADYIVTVTPPTGDSTATQIVNTEIKKVDVDATKAWSNADGTTTAPADATVTFELYANGEATGKTVVLDGKTLAEEIRADSTLSDEEKAARIAALDDLESGEFTAWKAEWRNLPKYSDDAQTQEITYTVKESASFPGYIDQNPDGVSTGGTIANKQLTVGFNLLKVEKDNNSNTLAGAEFVITPVKDSSTSSDIEYDGLSKDCAPKPTGNDGKTSFKGIAPGLYEVKETKTPDGYVIQGDSAFYVKVETNGDIKLMVKIMGDSSVTFAEASGGKAGNVSISEEGGAVTFTVENTPGAALPSSGGPGTMFFTAIGAALAGFAGVAITVTRVRRRTME